MNLLATAALVSAASLVAHGIVAGAKAASDGTETVDADGRLRVPTGYRTAYQFLGSWAVAAEQGHGSAEFHVVYASPGAITAHRRDGRFQDGAILVKEVFRTKAETLTTGTVSRADTLKGWFVMVKDSTNARAGNPLWGDGWGWSWFDAADPARTTTVDYRAECQGCHVPAQATDWIYTDGYPALKP
ncbi:cytochrome P460 family protein [Methylobacterium oryzisoli]|uniref:cytochrome P460 family protein n=1 Tax=Methylobacterium oryzisoli TaxID=3385502 RepID=UPI0038912BD0